MNNKISKIDDWIIPLYKIYTDQEDLNLVTKIIKGKGHITTRQYENILMRILTITITQFLTIHKITRHTIRIFLI